MEKCWELCCVMLCCIMKSCPSVVVADDVRYWHNKYVLVLLLNPLILLLLCNFVFYSAIRYKAMNQKCISLIRNIDESMFSLMKKLFQLKILFFFLFLHIKNIVELHCIASSRHQQNISRNPRAFLFNRWCLQSCRLFLSESLGIPLLS